MKITYFVLQHFQQTQLLYEREGTQLLSKNTKGHAVEIESHRIASHYHHAYTPWHFWEKTTYGVKHAYVRLKNVTRRVGIQSV